MSNRRQQEMQMQTKLVEDGSIITCISCEMWDNQNESCVKWNAKPPAKVIVIGCFDYEQKIPF